MFYNNKEELGFDDVSIRPKHGLVNSRKEIELDINWGNFKAKPYILSNMVSTGTIKAAKYLHKYKIPVCLHKFIDPLELEKFLDTPESEFTFITLGLNDSSKKHEHLLSKKKNVCIDAPNGYIPRFLDYVKFIKDKCSDSVVMAGNVIDDIGVEKIYRAGADIAKIQIGVGEVCETKNKAGVTRLPISTILDCYPVAKSWKRRLCSDGGIRKGADLNKALVAGSDYTMIGGMFAPYCEINNGEIQTEMGTGQRMIHFYGMSSKYACDKYADGLQSYRTSEGRSIFIPVKQNPIELIEQLNGGIASCATYIGVDCVEKFHNS